MFRLSGGGWDGVEMKGLLEAVDVGSLWEPMTYQLILLHRGAPHFTLIVPTRYMMN